VYPGDNYCGGNYKHGCWQNKSELIGIELNMLAEFKCLSVKAVMKLFVEIKMGLNMGVREMGTRARHAEG